MTLLLRAAVLNSTHENKNRITFIPKNPTDLRFCKLYQYFL